MLVGTLVGKKMFEYVGFTMVETMKSRKVASSYQDVSSSTNSIVHYCVVVLPISLK